MERFRLVEMNLMLCNESIISKVFLSSSIAVAFIPENTPNPTTINGAIIVKTSVFKKGDYKWDLV